MVSISSTWRRLGDGGDDMDADLYDPCEEFLANDPNVWYDADGVMTRRLV